MVLRVVGRIMRIRPTKNFPVYVPGVLRRIPKRVGNRFGIKPANKRRRVAKAVGGARDVAVIIVGMSRLHARGIFDGLALPDQIVCHACAIIVGIAAGS